MNIVADGGQLVLRVHQRLAWTQTTDRAHHINGPMRGEMLPDVGFERQPIFRLWRIVESRWHHADDCHHVLAQAQRASRDGGIGREVFHPHRMAEDHHVRAAARILGSS